MFTFFPDELIVANKNAPIYAR